MPRCASAGCARVRFALCGRRRSPRRLRAFAIRAADRRAIARSFEIRRAADRIAVCSVENVPGGLNRRAEDQAASSGSAASSVSGTCCTRVNPVSAAASSCD